MTEPKRPLWVIQNDMARLRQEAKAAKPGRMFSPGFKRSKSFKPSGEGQRQPRVRDNGHLAFIRRLPCVATYARTGAFIYGCQAAHLRMSSAAHGKPNPGGQRKPDDRWVTPLSAEQHRIQGDVMGEPRFWSDLGIDPFDLCTRLFAVSGDEAAAVAIIRSLRVAK